ncbi:MAG TPA: CPBP family glutamic-type intramembrane protease [Ornithinibacter sp.]|nr:CPBP family glutamic-type intramembrane protease [Ornithinibacter sp.]
MTVRIAVVGDRGDHPGHRELEATRTLLGPDVESWWVATDSSTMRDLSGFDALWLAPGAPYADGEAVLGAVRWAREQGVPLLGTCGGLQYAVVEFCRSVLGMPATHEEVDGPGAGAVITALAGSLQGEQRTVTPVPGSRFATLTAGMPFTGTHFCSYAPAPQTVRTLQQHGWVVEATAPDAGVEVLTLPTHPFLVLTLFQPQVGVLAGGRPHPVVDAFVSAARSRSRGRESWEAARARSAALAAAEAEPRPYVHQMRGPRHRWWRPLLAGLVAVPTWLLLVGALTGAFTLMGRLPGSLDELGTDPWGTLYGNLVIVALVPATMFGLWAGHRRSPWRVLSVAGRLRWGWLLWCAALVTPLWGAYLAVSWVVFDQEVLPRAEQWIGLVAVTLLTTPLQAAAEEIAFRGGLVQSVGSWFRSPVAALVVTTTLSTMTFAAAHGSSDPWIVLEIGSLAVAGCYLAWRTGGLEAVIVVHVVNNVLIMLTGAMFGGLEESYVDGTSTGSPVSAAMNVVATTIVTVLLVRLAQRRGVAPSGWLTPARG